MRRSSRGGSLENYHGMEARIPVLLMTSACACGHCMFQSPLDVISPLTVSHSITSPDSESILFKQERPCSFSSPPPLIPGIFTEPDSIYPMDETNECPLYETMICGQGKPLHKRQNRRSVRIICTCSSIPKCRLNPGW